MRRLVVAALAAVVCAPGAVHARPGSGIFWCPEADEPEPRPVWMDAMPARQETSFSSFDAVVPSADGTLLSARVYFPDALEPPYPAILALSPYGSLAGIYTKELEDAGVLGFADCSAPFFLQRGYAVVLADMRGTHNSDGCFDYGGPGDQQDGYALVEWIAAQPWSTGAIGMYGASHLGMSQYATAVAAPPHLRAIVPIEPITSFHRYLYGGGVHYETNLITPATYEYGAAGPPPTNTGAPNYAHNVTRTTCGTSSVARGTSLDGTMTAYWKARDYPSMAGRIRAAVYAVHGTFDENAKTDHFAAMWAALEAHDVPRKALFGPWGHSEPAVKGWRFSALRWFEHWLRGNDTGVTAEPAVTAIDQERTVRTASAYPPPGTEPRALEAGAGALRDAAPAGASTYRDVPGLPRAVLREAAGARLIYTGEPLGAPVRLSGTPVFEVVASIDARDSNFAVHLFDVAPDGTARAVTRGYLDARHRLGVDRAGVDVLPGEDARYRIELYAREYVFAAGSRLEVLLASSDSCGWLLTGPPFDRDPFCRSSGVVSDPIPAAVTVREGPGQTRLVLPSAPL